MFHTSGDKLRVRSLSPLFVGSRLRDSHHGGTGTYVANHIFCGDLNRILPAIGDVGATGSVQRQHDSISGFARQKLALLIELVVLVGKRKRVSTLIQKRLWRVARSFRIDYGGDCLRPDGEKPRDGNRNSAPVSGGEDAGVSGTRQAGGSLRGSVDIGDDDASRSE